MNRRFSAITAEEAGRCPENYVLHGGLATDRAPVARPPLVPVGGFAGVNEFAGPLQPAWGWESKVVPQTGEDAEGTLRDLRMSPYQRTFNQAQDARQSVTLDKIGRMDATAITLADPSRGTYIDYLPDSYVGEAPITDGAGARVSGDYPAARGLPY